MSFHHDPPRLRALHGELPEELALALDRAWQEHPTPEELAKVYTGTRAAIDAMVREARLPRVAPRRTARGRAAAVVFMFALGASAGVLGSVGALFITGQAGRTIAPSSTPSASLHAPDRRARHVPAPASPALVSGPAPSISSDDPAEASSAERRRAPAPSASRPSNGGDRSAAESHEREITPEPTAATQPSGLDELDLLACAQGALARDPRAALALIGDHERKFPQGALTQEGEVVAIDALLRLGRRAEAAARAERFHEQYPRSVHGRRIDVLLGAAIGN